MKEKLKKITFLVKIKKNLEMFIEYIHDYHFFRKNYMNNVHDMKSMSYEISLITHSIEKAFLNPKPRRFGIKKVYRLIEILNEINKNEYSYKVGINILMAYKTFYEKNNWQNAEEYTNVSKFLSDKSDVIKYNIGKIDCNLENLNFNVNYGDFLNDRHSVREFLNKKISDKDIEYAVNCAILTPSACNRQMCKIYYVDNSKLKEQVKKFAMGLGNFDLTGVNYFVVTFDVKAFHYSGERNQGWLNAGLFAMNFVNALHSLKIGSCFIEVGNSFKSEKELKKMLNIPECERIAVIITAGYYKKTFSILSRDRKEISMVYKKIK